MNEDGTYTHRNEQGWTEKYSANGYPLEIRNRQGIGWTLVLSAAIVSQALIITIQHSSGSHIRANFGFQGEISSAEDPAGIVYAYTHDLEAHDPVATACAPPLALRPIQPSPPTTVNGPRSPMHSPACPTHWENPQFELLTYAPTGMPGITDRHGVEYALIIHGWISPNFLIICVRWCKRCTTAFVPKTPISTGRVGIFRSKTRCIKRSLGRHMCRRFRAIQRLNGCPDSQGRPTTIARLTLAELVRRFLSAFRDALSAQRAEF